VVAEVARQAAARRQARLEGHRRMLGRVRLSRPRKPQWLELWARQVLPLRLASAAAVLAILGGLVVFNLPLLKVQRVEVEGSSVVGRSQLLQEAGARLGESTLLLDSARIRASLLDQPWVASASVQVRWPGTLVLAVTPLPPVLVYQKGQLSLNLAASGAVLGPVPQVPTTTPLPTLVDQRVGPGPADGSVAVPGNLAAALVALYRACPAAYGVGCSEFIISPVGALELKSSAGWVADLGPALTPAQIGSLGPKLEALRTLASKVNLKTAAIKEIYLEDPHQVVVSP